MVYLFAVTNACGDYVMPHIPSRTCNLTATTLGFATVTKPSISLETCSRDVNEMSYRVADLYQQVVVSPSTLSTASAWVHSQTTDVKIFVGFHPKDGSGSNFASLQWSLKMRLARCGYKRQNPQLLPLPLEALSKLHILTIEIETSRIL